MMVEIKKFYLFNKIRINSHLVAISFTNFLNDIPFFPKQKFFSRTVSRRCNQKNSYILLKNSIQVRANNTCNYYITFNRGAIFDKIYFSTRNAVSVYHESGIMTYPPLARRMAVQFVKL